MGLFRIKTLLAITIVMVTTFFAQAKEQTKEIIFNSNSIEFSSGKNFTVEIDGETIEMTFPSNTYAGTGTPVNCPEGIEDAQKFIIPKTSGGVKGYVIMDFNMFKDKDVKGVEIETWTDGNYTVELSVMPVVVMPGDSFIVPNSGSTHPTISKLTEYQKPISFVPDPEKSPLIENKLRIFFENQSSTSSAVVGLKSIKVTYDDGEPEDMNLAVLLDGEPAEEGQLVEPGSVLTIDTGGAPNAQVAYKIGDANVDTLLPAEGLTLSKPGTFIYHFTAVAPGYNEAHIDFTFTILGKIVVDTESINLAQSAAEIGGLTIFEPDSEGFESNKNAWADDEIQFYFEPGEEIRLERQEDEVIMLMLEPGAELQVSLLETNDKILKADIDGLHTENLQVSILDKENVSGVVRRAASWDAAGERATALLIKNIGEERAGISNLSLDVEKNIATEVEGIEESDIFAAEYYDLSGRKVLNPENGIFVERKGNKARLVIIKR